MKAATWRIGLSGFSNKDWKGVFYPEGMPQKQWFAHYCAHFNCVEINASFYRVPTLKTLQKWRDESPEDFQFSLKVHRNITHYKQFRDCQAEAADFYALLQEGIGSKLGAVLFQCPPKFSYTPERLELLLQTLDTQFNNVVEFRHKSWWTAEVFAALDDQKICMSGVDYPGDIPREVLWLPASGKTYYRFHGRPVLFKSLYSEAEIRDVYTQLRDTEAPVHWVCFNNTWGHSALQNAAMLKNLLGAPPLEHHPPAPELF